MAKRWVFKAARCESLVTTAAAFANGQSHVAVNLGATVPGLLSLTLDLAISEAAAFRAGSPLSRRARATVRTAQTRLRLMTEVGGTGLLAGVGGGAVLSE